MDLQCYSGKSTHRNKIIIRLLIAPVLIAIFLTSCVPLSQEKTAQVNINVTLLVDQTETQIDVPPNSTVQNVLSQAGITLNPLDRIEPASFTTITDQQIIKVTRIEEKYEVEENTVPFSSQTVRNESLPEGQTRLIQPGENGVQQVTYRIRYEDGDLIQRSIFKTVNVVDPKPEIVMVGVQSPFSPIALNGVIAYIANGNAWVMEGTTANRRPVLTSGDLDGKVFALSPDQTLLLFSRTADENEEGIINSLWVIDITDNNAQAISLNVENVVHFADWISGSTYAIAYSTVEARETAPGWQANNDLNIVYLTKEGNLGTQEEIIETNAGGIYGWWGTTYAISPSGDKFAYSRPESIGMVNFIDGTVEPLVEILPYQTHSDWAWVSQISWTSDENFMYVVSHRPASGLTSEEESPIFNIGVLSLSSDNIIDIVNQAGMFSYPVVSPDLGSNRNMIAYLQAIFPEQSETSRYHLMLMDRDGSNQNKIFPDEGLLGMDPQSVAWSPMETTDDSPWLAFHYQGNLWLYDVYNNQSRQITGDGSIGKVDWK
ncbi:MAG: G5 domain-containing protein [Anaerolineaceae bacterium]|nr:G5 domain-containing protein [Anaerolineaceae bacterium]